MSSLSNIEAQQKISVRERLQHFTWAWYVISMSCGGYATLLHVQPHTFPGLETIGKVVFLSNLVAFFIITIVLIHRFYSQKKLFLRSLRNPTELLFVPTGLLSCAVILIGIQAYGVPSCGPWLLEVVYVLFWCYVVVSFLLAVAAYLYLFTAKKLTTQDMTPAWLLPIFPAMIAGTVAGAIAQDQPAERRLPILVAGLTFQGLGFWAAIPLYGTFISRLLQFGLPSANLRPGMFIAVGPPSFTCLALIKMSHSLPLQSTYFQQHPTAAEALTQIALAFGIFIWTLSFWFFSISLASCLMAYREISFHLIAYGLVFPNVGFTTATIYIGQDLYSQPILWVGSAMTIVLTLVLITVLILHIKALWKGDILWPGKDEDKDT